MRSARSRPKETSGRRQHRQARPRGAGAADHRQRGLEGSVIVRKKEKGGNWGFNAQTDQIVDMIKAGIIDPAKVTKQALQNAASIAGLMLTTEAIVSEIKEESKSDGGAGAAGMGGMGGMYYRFSRDDPPDQRNLLLRVHRHLLEQPADHDPGRGNSLAEGPDSSASPPPPVPISSR
jgi:hypothetical protein